MGVGDMRNVLDRVYGIAQWAAGACILFICAIVTVQVGLNITARIGGPEWSYTLPSYADFAGYFLAAASFFALAPTLRAGGHIRVNLLVQSLSEKPRWITELFCLLFGTVLVGYATFYAAALLHESWDYGDKSTGIIAIPLWLPQSAMVLGLFILTVALVDTLIETLIAKQPVLPDNGSE